MITEYFTIPYFKKDKRAQGHYFRDKVVEAGLMNKEEYYKWLQEQLGLSHGECHFSRMSSTKIIAAILTTVRYLNEAYMFRLTDLPWYEQIKRTEHQTKNNQIPTKYKAKDDRACSK